MSRFSCDKIILHYPLYVLMRKLSREHNLVPLVPVRLREMFPFHLLFILKAVRRKVTHDTKAKLSVSWKLIATVWRKYEQTEMHINKSFHRMTKKLVY